MVTAFGPGVGKEDIERMDRTGRHHVSKRIGRFHMDQADIRDVLANQFLLDLAQSHQKAVDAQKIDVREAL